MSDRGDMPTSRQERRIALRFLSRLSIHVVLPLTVGAASYALWRPGVVGLQFLHVAPSRVRRPPQWFLDHGLDALWAYALTAFVALVWSHSRDDLPWRRFWLMAASTLIVGVECLQTTDLVPGTFDVVDLAVESAAFVVALVCTSLHFGKERGEECLTVEGSC